MLIVSAVELRGVPLKLRDNLYDLIFATYFLIFGLGQAIQGIIPVTLRENGLFWTEFTPWDQVISYGWGEKNKNTFTLTRKRKFLQSEARNGYSVVTEDLEKADEILRRYVRGSASEAVG